MASSVVTVSGSTSLPNSRNSTPKLTTRRFGHGRDSRSGSLDDLDSGDTAQLAEVRKAIADLDAKALKDLQSSWTSHTILDTRKFRGPLHALVLAYVSHAAEFIVASEALLQLNQKFEDCVRVLLEQGVDANEGDAFHNAPLHLLCQSGAPVNGAIAVLLASGAKVNQVNGNEQTALHLVSTEGTVREVEALVSGGADLNTLDCVAMSPLHYAVKYRRAAEIVSSLVSAGASVNLQDRDSLGSTGPTALHTAVKAGRPENVTQLLGLGADVTAENAAGQTALHLAAATDITGSIVDILLKHEAPVNTQDAIHQDTPLHKAIKRNMATNVRLLCQAGASLSMADGSGQSCLHWAATSCTDMGIWVTLLNSDQADLKLLNNIRQTLLERASKSSNKLAVGVLKQVLG